MDKYPSLRDSLPQILTHIQGEPAPQGYVDRLVRTADGRVIRIADISRDDLATEAAYADAAKAALDAEQAVWDDAEAQVDYPALMRLLKSELSAHLAAGNLETIRGLMEVISEPLRSEVLRLIDSADTAGLSAWIDSIGGVR